LLEKNTGALEFFKSVKSNKRVKSASCQGRNLELPSARIFFSKKGRNSAI